MSVVVEVILTLLPFILLGVMFALVLPRTRDAMESGRRWSMAMSSIVMALCAVLLVAVLSLVVRALG